MLSESEKKLTGAPEKTHAQERIIGDTRDLLLYGAELCDKREISLKELAELYQALDAHKRAAFAGAPLNEFPETILDLLMKDKDEEVQKALRANPTFFAHKRFFTVGDWVQLHGLKSREEIVEKGRKVIARLLDKVQRRKAEEGEGLLRAEEARAIENMARHIPDPRVINALMGFVGAFPRIGEALLKNPLLQGKAEGVDEKVQAVAASLVMGELLGVAEQNLKSGDGPGTLSHQTCRMILEAYRLIASRQNGFQAFRGTVIRMAQRYPDLAKTFMSPQIDQETFREIFSIQWIRGVVRNPRWEKALKELYRKRFDLPLNTPMARELEKHPDIPGFLYSNRR